STILSDDEARRPAFGSGGVLDFSNIGIPVAVKTGTSFDWFDNWTVGYSPDLVVGVWIGNAANQPLRELDGAVGAAPVFREIMFAAHSGAFDATLAGVQDEPRSEAFAAPDGLIPIDVCTSTGGLARPSDTSETVLVDRQAR